MCSRFLTSFDFRLYSHDRIWYDFRDELIAEHEADDQLHGYKTAYLHLCFLIRIIYAKKIWCILEDDYGIHS